MGTSGPGPDWPTVADARLPSDAEAVVARWNPEGIARLRRTLTTEQPHASVAVIGPERSGTTSLIEELEALDPDLTFVESPAEAAVVVILLDASAPIGSAALRLIDRIATIGSPAVFALNKIDAHSDWRSVRDRDLLVLAQNAAQFADVPIRPVSARLAKIARTQGAAEVLKSSGIVELHGVLTSELARHPVRSSATHLVRETERVAEHTLERINGKVLALRTSDNVATVRADRARLVARRDGGRSEATATLRSQVQLARVELLHDVASRIRTLNITARTEIDRADKTALAAFPERLGGYVAALTADVDERSRERLGELGAKVLGETVAVVPPGARPELGAGPEPRHRGVEDRIMVVFGASAGVGIGRLAVDPLSMVPALDIASIPVTLVLGGCAAWWLTRSRSQVADRAHLRQWATESLVNVKSQLEQRVLGSLVGTEAELSEHIVRRSATRIVDVDAQIAQLDADLRQLAAQTSGQLASCERDRDVVSRGLAQLRAKISAQTSFVQDGTDRTDGASNSSR